MAENWVQGPLHHTCDFNAYSTRASLLLRSLTNGPGLRFLGRNWRVSEQKKVKLFQMKFFLIIFCDRGTFMCNLSSPLTFPAMCQGSQLVARRCWVKISCRICSLSCRLAQKHEMRYNGDMDTHKHEWEYVLHQIMHIFQASTCFSVLTTKPIPRNNFPSSMIHRPIRRNWVLWNICTSS
jgi:hypothetical protein